MTATLEPLVEKFQNGLRKIIVENAATVQFTHPQYTIEKISPYEYDITVSITKMGVQALEISVLNGEFMVRGKLVDTDEKFPLHLISDLINEAITKSLAESMKNPTKQIPEAIPVVSAPPLSA
jgi:hypothetical protein